MGEYWTAVAGDWIDVPGNILFDGDRKWGLKGAFNPIRPPEFCGITIVCIRHGTIMVEEVEPGSLGTSGHNDQKKTQKHLHLNQHNAASRGGEHFGGTKRALSSDSARSSGTAAEPRRSRSAVVASAERPTSART